MKHLKTFETYDDYIQKDLHAAKTLDEDKRMEIIQYIIDYVSDVSDTVESDIEEAKIELINMPAGQLLDLYNKLSNQTFENVNEIKKMIRLK